MLDPPLLVPKGSILIIRLLHLCLLGGPVQPLCVISKLLRAGEWSSLTQWRLVDERASLFDVEQRDLPGVTTAAANDP